MKKIDKEMMESATFTFEEGLKALLSLEGQRNGDAKMICDTLLVYAMAICESTYKGNETWRHYIVNAVKEIIREK